jgi:ribosome recycling factor
LPLPCSTLFGSVDFLWLGRHSFGSGRKDDQNEEVVQHEFAGVRTGKASPAGGKHHGGSLRSQNALARSAGITTPEHRMLVIQPWDATTVHPIEKAIQKANLGTEPAVQGKIIRIVLPELSEERRQEFVKIVHKMTESGRVAIRHVRRDALEHVKKEAKNGGISEEDVEHAEKEIQKLTDHYIAKLEAHLQHKEKEIMTV